MFLSVAINSDLTISSLLSAYLSKHPHIKPIKVFDHIRSADDLPANLVIDIGFFDLDHFSATEFHKLSDLQRRVKRVILLVKDKRYAESYFDLDADGYLLHPINEQKLYKLLDRVVLMRPFIGPLQRDFIFVRSDQAKSKFLKINVKDIIAIEAKEKDSKIITVNGDLWSNTSFSTLLKTLEPYSGFSQIHRSFVIAEAHIRSIEKKYVVLSNNAIIHIGRTYSAFYSKMTGITKFLILLMSILSNDITFDLYA